MLSTNLFQRPLANVFDRKYFIRTYDKLMIHKRSLKRYYIPPDPAGYFDQYVWPMYLKNLEKISNQKDISKFYFIHTTE